MIAYLIGALIGAAIALGVYILVQKMVLNGQKNEIIAKAEIEAEGIKNDKIHQAKREDPSGEGEIPSVEKRARTIHQRQE